MTDLGRIFLSYGHDEYTYLARQLKLDLERRGCEVWFDVERLVPGAIWETYIEEGLEWVTDASGPASLVLLMTPHSVRRPDGYCLNELSWALSRGLAVIPLMVVDVEPPLSIARVQWLDLRDAVPLPERAARYSERFDLVAMRSGASPPSARESRGRCSPAGSRRCPPASRSASMNRRSRVDGPLAAR